MKTMIFFIGVVSGEIIRIAYMLYVYVFAWIGFGG